MRKTIASAILAAVFAAAGVTAADATSLRVTPVGLQLTAPSAATSLTLTNEDDRPTRVQIRVFRWTQTNGVERYERTDDVVASPPVTMLNGGSKLTIRIARVSGRPVSAEESYRIVIDQLPDPAQKGTASVALAMRYLVPLFFSHPAQKPPALSWNMRRNGGKIEITASNHGQRRIRLSDLALTSRSGQSAKLAPGLAGYVLAGSSKTWEFEASRVAGLPGGPVTIEAISDAGQVKSAGTLR